MGTTSSVKAAVREICVSSGLYRPGRLSRLLNRSQRNRFRNDVSFYSQLVKTDSLCFDIGAHVGEKTEALLKAGSRVVAFEPQPSCAKELKARCSGYRGRLEVVEKAVGAECGQASLYVNQNSVVSSFYQAWADSYASIQVPVTTLNDAIARFGRPAYCKIDVEGWEFEVLRGLTQAIPLISFEYHLGDTTMDHMDECLSYLGQFGELGLNVTPAETLSFAFEDWVGTEEFHLLFTTQLQHRPEYNYGDVFARINSR